MSANRLMMIALALALTASTLPTTQAQTGVEPVNDLVAQVIAALQGIGAAVTEQCLQGNVPACLDDAAAAGLGFCDPSSQFPTDCIPVPVPGLLPAGDGAVATIDISGALPLGGNLLLPLVGEEFTVTVRAFIRDGNGVYGPLATDDLQLLVQRDCGDFELAIGVIDADICQGSNQYVHRDPQQSDAAGAHTFTVTAEQLVDAFATDLPLGVVHIFVTMGESPRIGSSHVFLPKDLALAAGTDQASLVLADSLEAIAFTPTVLVAGDASTPGDGFIAHYEWPEGSIVTGTNSLAVPLDGDLVIGATLYGRDGSSYAPTENFNPGLLLEVDCGGLAAAPGFAERCSTSSTSPGDQSNQGFIRMDVQDDGGGHYTFTAPQALLASAFFAAEPAGPVTLVHALVVPNQPGHESSSYSVLVNTVLVAAAASGSDELFALADALDHSLWHPVALANLDAAAAGDGYTARFSVVGAIETPSGLLATPDANGDITITANVYLLGENGFALDRGELNEFDFPNAYSLSLWTIDEGFVGSFETVRYPASDHLICHPNADGDCTITIPAADLGSALGPGGFTVTLTRLEAAEDYANGGNAIGDTSLFLPRDLLLTLGEEAAAPAADLMDAGFTPLFVLDASVPAGGDGYTARITIEEALPTVDGSLVLRPDASEVKVKARPYLRQGAGYVADNDPGNLYSLAFWYVNGTEVTRFPPTPSPDFVCHPLVTGECVFPAIARESFPQFAEVLGNGFSVDVTRIDTTLPGDPGVADSYLFLPKEALLAAGGEGAFAADVMDTNLGGPFAPVADAFDQDAPEANAFTPFFVTPQQAVGVPASCIPADPSIDSIDIGTCVADVQGQISALPACSAVLPDPFNAAVCTILDGATTGDGFVAQFDFDTPVPTLLLEANEVLTFTVNTFVADEGEFAQADVNLGVALERDCGGLQPLIDGLQEGSCTPSAKVIAANAERTAEGTYLIEFTPAELAPLFLDGTSVTAVHLFAVDNHGSTDLNRVSHYSPVVNSLPMPQAGPVADALDSDLWTPVILSTDAFPASGDGFVAAISLPSDPVVGVAPVLSAGDVTVTVFTDDGDGFAEVTGGSYNLVIQVDCGDLAEVVHALAEDRCAGGADTETLTQTYGFTANADGNTIAISEDDLARLLNGLPATAVHIFVETSTPTYMMSNYATATSALMVGGADAAPVVDLVDAQLWNPVLITGAALPAGDGFVASFDIPVGSPIPVALAGEDLVFTVEPLVRGSDGYEAYSGELTAYVQLNCGELTPILSAVAGCQDDFHTIDSSVLPGPTDGVYTFTVPAAKLAQAFVPTADLAAAFPAGYPLSAVNVFVGDAGAGADRRYSSFSLQANGLIAAEAADLADALDDAGVPFTPVVLVNAALPVPPLPAACMPAVGMPPEFAPADCASALAALADCTAVPDTDLAAACAELVALPDTAPQTLVDTCHEVSAEVEGAVDDVCARFASESGNGPSLDITVSDASAGEPADHGKFTITRSGTETGEALDVSFTVSGTAVRSVRYELRDDEGAVLAADAATIPAGKASVNVTVHVFDDAVYQGDQTVVLDITGNGFENGTKTASITIVDDEMPPAGPSAFGATFNLPDGTPLGKVPVVHVGNDSLTFEVHAANVDADGNPNNYPGDLTFFVQVDCGALFAILGELPGTPCMANDEVVFQATNPGSADGDHSFTVPAGGLAAAFNLGLPASAVHLFVADDGSTGETRYASFALQAEVGYLIRDDDPVGLGLDTASEPFTPVLLLGDGVPIPGPEGVPAECAPSETMDPATCAAALDGFIGPFLCDPTSESPINLVGCTVTDAIDGGGLPEGDGFVAAFWLPDVVETTVVPAILVGEELAFGVQPFTLDEAGNWIDYTGALTLHIQVDCGALEPVLAEVAPCMAAGDVVETQTLPAPNGDDGAPYVFTVTDEQLAAAFELGLPLSAVHLFVSDHATGMGQEPFVPRYSSYSLPTEILLVLDEGLADAAQANNGGPVPFTPVVLVGELPALPDPTLMACGSPVEGPFDCPTLTVTASQTSFVEDGSLDYVVRLGGRVPEGPVSIAITPTLSDVHASPATLVIEPETWDVPRTVTLHADQNPKAQGSRGFTVNHVATGDAFDGLTAAFAATVVDPVRAGVVVQIPNGAAVVQGHAIDILVSLASEPTEPVGVEIAYDGTTLVVGPESLMFATDQWSVPQAVRIEGRQTGAENDVTSLLRFSAASPGETTGYASLADAGSQSILVLRAGATLGNGGGLGSPASPASTSSSTSQAATSTTSATSTTGATSTTSASATSTTSTSTPPTSTGPTLTLSDLPPEETPGSGDGGSDGDAGSDSEQAAGEGGDAAVVPVAADEESLLDIPAPGIALLGLALLAVALVVRRKLR